MSHVREHCRTPRFFLWLHRHRIWRCECGLEHVLTSDQAGYHWTRRTEP